MNRKIVVKGKYLKAIEEYVDTLSLDGQFFFKTNPKFHALIEAVLALHRSVLSKDNAQAIVFRECMMFSAAQNQQSGSLADPTNAPLKSMLVNRLKEYIESLPRTYVLRIQLTSLGGLENRSHEISDQIQLVTGPHKFDYGDSERLNALAEAVRQHGNPSTYFQFTSQGYADWSSESPAVSDCISLAKQCAFLFTTYGIFKSNFSQGTAKATLTTELTGETGTITLPSSLAKCFAQLVVNEEMLLVDDNAPTAGLQRGLASTLLVGRQRKAETPQERTDGLGYVLFKIRQFFAAANHVDFPSIAAAIEWYQDSVFADNQTFAYLAACIGLEALLGSDTQLDSMSKRLADRYAFLLGKGRSERTALIEDYTRVLNLRGKLVHAKAARLEGDDRALLGLAQRMLLNAIWHELHEMYRDKKPVA